MRWGRWAVLALLLAIVLGAILAWVFRIALASAYVRSDCSARGLECAFALDALTLDGAAASEIAITTRDGTPVRIATAQADIAWPSWRTPQLASVDLQGADLRARYDGEALSLYGLETAFAGSGGGETIWPKIVVDRGTIALDTPAGTLGGAFTLNLESRTDGTVQLAFSPADLASGEDHLTLASGTVDVSLRAGRPSGRMDIEITSASFAGFTADAALLQAETRASPSGGETISMRLAAQRLRAGDIEAEAATLAAEAGLAQSGLDDLNLESVFNTLEMLDAQLNADVLRYDEDTATGVRFDVDLNADPAGLAGPLAFTAQTTSSARLGRSGPIRFTGDIRGASADAATLEGRFTGEAIGLAPELRAAWSERVNLPGLLSRHGAALRRAMGEALSDMSITTSGRVEWARGEPVSFDLRRQSSLRAASGLTAQLRPFSTGGSWATSTGDAITLRGDLALSGGGAPRLQAQIDELTLGERVDVRLGEAQLSPWRAGGLTLAADTTALRFTRADGAIRLSGAGELRLDGKVGAVTLDEATLFGAIEAVQGPEGWRGQVTNGDCLAVAFSRAQLQALTFGVLRTRLCPAEGRLVRQGPDGPEGTFVLGRLALPFSASGATGDLALAGTEIDWRWNRQVRADVSGRDFALALETGPRALDVTAQGAAIGVSIGGGSPATLDGRLDTIAFDGSLMPADVRAGAGQFTFTDTAAGVMGEASLTAMTIADRRSDPIYETMAIETLGAQLRDGQLEMSGPVTLAASGKPVASAALDLSFPDINGALRVTTGALQLAPGRLQPREISDRLRGYFTDARGTINSEAVITITNGVLGGTGRVAVRELSFQTIGLGRVGGVNGEVAFSDLLALQSPPGQRVTIATIDPGLLLENGELRFQLTGGGTAELNSAVWPFAGGELTLAPVTWEVGAPERTLTVDAREIELTELTRLLDLPGFQAEGTVSGAFPIVMRAGDTFIENARLSADGGGGTLRYTGGIAERASDGNEQVALAFEALRNFQFTVLEVGANGNVADDIVLTARLEGRNPDVLEGTSFNFNVSVDSKLGQLLANTRKLTGTDWLAEITARQAEPEPETP